MAIARPSAGDIIVSAWGDAVADAINGLHAYRYMKPSAQTVPGSSGVTVAILTTPVIPVGMVVFVMMQTIYHAPGTAGDFDIQYITPGGTIVNQTSPRVQTVINAYSASFVGAGIAMTFSILINTWAAQPVSVDAGTAIHALVLPA